MESKLSPGPSVDISVVVVSYNTAQLTIDCLSSVFEQTADTSIEVIVVDNASTDDSAERIAAEFPKVVLLASKENHGFGVATNIGVSVAHGEWILLLNPDTVVKDHAIDNIFTFANDNPHAAVFGGRTVDQFGNLDPTSCWAKTTPWSAFCRALGLSSAFSGSNLFNPEAICGWQRDTVREVDVITGCFLLVKKLDWSTLGGFDPRFFMYGEEADLCLRASKSGMRLLFCPSAEILHYGGASETVRADKVVRLFKAKAQVYALHWSKPAFWFGRLTLTLWAWSRFILCWTRMLFNRNAKESYTTWKNIWGKREAWRNSDLRSISALSEAERRIPTIE